MPGESEGYELEGTAGGDDDVLRAEIAVSHGCLDQCEGIVMSCDEGRDICK